MTIFYNRDTFIKFMTVTCLQILFNCAGAQQQTAVPSKPNINRPSIESRSTVDCSNDEEYPIEQNKLPASLIDEAKLCDAAISASESVIEVEYATCKRQDLGIDGLHVIDVLGDGGEVYFLLRKIKSQWRFVVSLAVTFGGSASVSESVNRISAYKIVLEKRPITRIDVFLESDYYHAGLEEKREQRDTISVFCAVLSGNIRCPTRLITSRIVTEYRARETSDHRMQAYEKPERKLSLKRTIKPSESGIDVTTTSTISEKDRPLKVDTKRCLIRIKVE